MSLKLYNTLSRRKEILKPLKGKKISLFVCGPTVYDLPHIGHAKTYTQFDIIVKYLRYRGYKVFYLQNITNLDDKIISKAKEENLSVKKLAKKYEKNYYEDMKSLGVDSVSKYARATDYIKEIISQVDRLMKKGYAYEIKGDGIYYNLKRFKDYGKLSRRKTLDAEDAISRIDDSIGKKNKGDFCLWKFSKKNGSSWNSKFGKGRPGWHIEDTAITEKNLGEQYDLHGGARDLIFPHHEAEIAQMEALSGKKLVNYWMHTGFLNVESQKMSKSLGNFITIRDILKKHGKNALRLFYISTHYRSSINFSSKMLEQSENSLERLNEFMRKLKASKNKDNPKLIKKTKEDFVNAMDDDFDTVNALAVIFNFVREVNKKGGGKKSYQLMLELDKIFGLDLGNEKKISIPKKIKELAEKREKARKEKEWKKADELRKKINQLGFIIEDTEQGYFLRRK